MGLSGNSRQRRIQDGIDEFKKSMKDITKKMNSSNKEKQDRIEEKIEKANEKMKKEEVDRGIVCTKQLHKITKKDSRPPDQLDVNSRGIGQIRPPHPSEVTSPFECIDFKLIPLHNPLPGLEVPGRIY
jgi:hypothetical protein